MKLKTEDLLVQRNNLLERQNNLLEQMNNLLQAKNSTVMPISTEVGFREEFVENLYSDEMRNGFLVTSHRKKLWNVQIDLIKEVARICEKHNLKYFAAYGTLLGAARHGGFIPWDDDVDLFMLRPDYEKFKQIAAEEIKYPYYLDAYWNYRYEDDENPVPEESNLPLIKSNDPQKFGNQWPLVSILKLRDSRTFMIEFPQRSNINQGIWIDIFPLDPGSPFSDERKQIIFNLECDLTFATLAPHIIRNLLKENSNQISNKEILQKFLLLTHRERALTVEDTLSKNFFESEYLSDIGTFVKMQTAPHYKTKNFKNPIYLPFEKIEIPAPSNYDEVLKTDYGDWHKMLYKTGHTSLFSADISYKDFFKNININIFS